MMRVYSVIYSEIAIKQLKKTDRHQALLLYNWIAKNLSGCENPRAQGKALTGDKSGYWRYRVGVYRIIAEIQDDKIVISIVHVGHRKEIYK